MDWIPIKSNEKKEKIRDIFVVVCVTNHKMTGFRISTNHKETGFRMSTNHKMTHL